MAKLGLSMLLLVMFVLFISAVFLGFLAATALASRNRSEALDMLRQVVEELPMPQRFYSLETALRIFAWNLRVALMCIALGFLVVAPSVVVFANGVLVGIVIALVVQSLGSEGGLLAIAAIAPHGVIEVPAILLSAALGTKIGIEFWRWVFKRFRDGGRLVNTVRALLVALPIITAMLFVASIVEAFVTPYIIENLLGFRLP